MENKLFLFRINYQNLRTGAPASTKIGIIKAKDKESARKLIWQDFGSDNATLKDDDISDVTGLNYASVQVFYPKTNTY